MVLFTNRGRIPGYINRGINNIWPFWPEYFSKNADQLQQDLAGEHHFLDKNTNKTPPYFTSAQQYSWTTTKKVYNDWSRKDTCSRVKTGTRITERNVGVCSFLTANKKRSPGFLKAAVAHDSATRAEQTSALQKRNH